MGVEDLQGRQPSLLFKEYFGITYEPEVLDPLSQQLFEQFRDYTKRLRGEGGARSQNWADFFETTGFFLSIFEPFTQFERITTGDPYCFFSPFKLKTTVEEKLGGEFAFWLFSQLGIEKKEILNFSPITPLTQAQGRLEQIAERARQFFADDFQSWQGGGGLLRELQEGFWGQHYIKDALDPSLLLRDLVTRGVITPEEVEFTQVLKTIATP